MICLVIMLIIAAQLAHCTLIIAGIALDFVSPPSTKIAQTGYYFLVFLRSTGAGFVLVFLPGLGLVRKGFFKRPCPKVVILILVAWIAFVGSGWVWRATASHEITVLTYEQQLIVDMVTYEIASTPLHDTVYAIIGNVWRIRNIETQPNQRYCAEVESYLWMRIPTGRQMFCYDLSESASG